MIEKSEKNKRNYVEKELFTFLQFLRDNIVPKSM